MATYKGPIAGPVLLQQAIDRTAENFKQIRAGRRQRSVSANNCRYVQQRLFTFDSQENEANLHSRLLALRDNRGR
jgi:hypothetical protein